MRAVAFLVLLATLTALVQATPGLKTLWSVPIDDAVTDSVSVTANGLYIATDAAGAIFAVNMESGAFQWSNSGGGSLEKLVVSDDRPDLLLATYRDHFANYEANLTVKAIDLGTGATRWVSESMPITLEYNGELYKVIFNAKVAVVALQYFYGPNVETWSHLRSLDLNTGAVIASKKYHVSFMMNYFLSLTANAFYFCHNRPTANCVSYNPITLELACSVGDADAPDIPFTLVWGHAVKGVGRYAVLPVSPALANGSYSSPVWQLLYDLDTCTMVNNLTKTFNGTALYLSTETSTKDELYFTAPTKFFCDYAHIPNSTSWWQLTSSVEVNLTQWTVFRFDVQAQAASLSYSIDVSPGATKTALRLMFGASQFYNPILRFLGEDTLVFSWFSGALAFNTSSLSPVWSIPTDVPSAQPSAISLFPITDTLVMFPNMQGFALYNVVKRKVEYFTVDHPLFGAVPFVSGSTNGTTVRTLVSVNPSTGAIEGQIYSP